MDKFQTVSYFGENNFIVYVAFIKIVLYFNLK